MKLCRLTRWWGAPMARRRWWRSTLIVRLRLLPLSVCLGRHRFGRASCLRFISGWRCAVASILYLILKSVFSLFSILYSLFCWWMWIAFSHVFLSHEKVAFVVHQGGIPIKNLVVDKSSVLLLSVLFLLNKTNGYVFFVGVSLWWYRLFSGTFEFSEC